MGSNAVELTQQLVRMNTINPPGLEKPCAVVLGGMLEKAGWRGWLDVARQDVPGPFLDVESLRGRNGPDQLTLL